MKATLEAFVDKTLDLVTFQFLEPTQFFSGMPRPKICRIPFFHRCGPVSQIRINSSTDDTVDDVMDDASTEVGVRKKHCIVDVSKK